MQVLVSEKNRNKNNTSKPAPTVGTANPASAYCEKQGGKPIIVKGSKGEYGVCQLKMEQLLKNGNITDKIILHKALKLK